MPQARIDLFGPSVSEVVAPKAEVGKRGERSESLLKVKRKREEE